MPVPVRYLKRKSKKATPQRTTQSNGFSCKEKSYIINHCQARLPRYKALKKLAAQAIAKNKIFSVYGVRSDSVPVLRKALSERGWIEKLPPHRMNLSKISNGILCGKTEIHCELEKLLLASLIEKCTPNFIWYTDGHTRANTIDMKSEYVCTMINKLTSDTLWTTKHGLCSSLKRNYWFYIEDVADVNGPRSYITSDTEEMEGFDKDYKITACTSLLKWVVSMTANERPIFVESGKISINLILFAINRCQEYLFMKQNRDIDQSITDINPDAWDVFLQNYYRLIRNEDTFRADDEKLLSVYLPSAKSVINQMYKYRPQLSCEGCYNIWIIKPAHNSRGRGIRMASNLGVIRNILDKAHLEYVVQKYIEDPLLIYETKFDIRQYYLITSTFPLVIWMYRECYLKFSSQKYNLKDFHESIHLTNNAVQRKYKNTKGRHNELPASNMWDLDTFKKYLIKIGKNKVWENTIYAGMKKSIISIMLSCQDSLLVSKNRFELYGCDFILDKEFKPWLIEINSCPDLNHTTNVTAKICSSVVTDIVKVVIDHANNSSSPTGYFECIYRQPMTMPRYGRATDLVVCGRTLPDNYFYRLKAPNCFNEPYTNNMDYQLLVMNEIDTFDEMHAIMREPDEIQETDHEESKKKEQETCTHYSKSEYELKVAAVIITAQLEDIITKVIKESARLKQKKDLCYVKTPVKCTSIKSITDIKIFLQRALSVHHEMDGDQSKSDENFKFSELDDGSSLNIISEVNARAASSYESIDFMQEPSSKMLHYMMV